MTPDPSNAQPSKKERPQARPRFELTTEHSPEVVLQRVRVALRRNKSVVGLIFPGRVELMMPREAIHIWSPLLFVDVKPSGSGSRLEARFAPNLQVWTAYVGACVISSMATFGALMLAIAQWIMNDRLWGLWVAPGTALVAALTFGAAFVGQGLSGPQMFELRDFLRRALEEPLPEAEEDAEPAAASS